jgi:hypothetical protein
LAIARNSRQIVEPGEFLFQLASLFVMISRHGEDLLTSNPATVFENPGLVAEAEVPQKIKNVIRLHRGIQAFKNCLIHFFDGRKRPTAMADDGSTQPGAFTGTNPATEATAPGLRFIVRVHNLRNGV